MKACVLFNDITYFIRYFTVQHLIFCLLGTFHFPQSVHSTSFGSLWFTNSWPSRSTQSTYEILRFCASCSVKTFHYPVIQNPEDTSVSAFYCLKNLQYSASPFPESVPVFEVCSFKTLQFPCFTSSRHSSSCSLLTQECPPPCSHIIRNP